MSARDGVAESSAAGESTRSAESPAQHPVQATPAKPPKPKPGSFDRIRRDGVPDAASGRDPQGKQALFSGAEQPPSLGSVALDCPLCHRRTVVSMVRLAQMSLPGVHVPVPKRGYRAWVKCPACGRRTWMRVTLGR